MPVQTTVSEKSEVVDSKPADLLDKLSPDALPSLPATDSGNAPKQNLFHKAKWFVLLALVLLILLVIVSLLIFAGKKSSGLLGKVPAAATSGNLAAFVAPVNVLDVEFSSDLQRDRFLKNFQEAGKTADLNTRYKLLLDNFGQLEAIYSANHSPKTRKLLVDYSAYLSKNFPENSKRDSLVLSVPCFDSSCGVANYPVAVKVLVSEIKASVLSDEVKQAVLAKIDEAAYSKDPTVQWTAYLNGFNLVKSQYDLKKDAGVKAVALVLVDFMKADYPDKYATAERLFPDAFKLE